MKFLSSNKAIITLLSLGSLVVAGTIKDINSRTVTREHAFSEELAPAERTLASDDEGGDRIALTKVGMDQAYKINSNWEVTRIIGADEVVTFDKNHNPEDSKKMIKVPMKLIGTSQVMLNNDPALVYNISLLSDFGTIAIFKKMGKGVEILEAKILKEVKTDAQLAVSDEVELVLERALNPKKSSTILTGADISGEMVLTKKSFEGLTVSLTNKNGEVQNIEISSAQLLDGGAFKADVDDQEVSGVIFNNGKDGYRLSFVTGPLEGAMLNFVTKEELARIEDAASAQPENGDSYFQADEPEAAREVAAVQKTENTIQDIGQEQILEDRRDIANEATDENYEAPRILSAEEVKETAETQGFSF